MPTWDFEFGVGNKMPTNNLLESLKAEYPSLTIEHRNEGIRAVIGTSWIAIATENEACNLVENLNIKEHLHNFVLFKELETQLLQEDPSHRGAYLLVNSRTSRFLYETFNPAWRARDPNGYVGLLGLCRP